MSSMWRPGRFILFVLLMGGFIFQAWAGGSARREQMVANYSGCDWTDPMGQELYQCIKDNNGFSTLWCFNTTIENNCEEKSAAESDLNSLLAQNDTDQVTDSGGTTTIDSKKFMKKQWRKNIRCFSFVTAPTQKRWVTTCLNASKSTMDLMLTVASRIR